MEVEVDEERKQGLDGRVTVEDWEKDVRDGDRLGCHFMPLLDAAVVKSRTWRSWTKKEKEDD